MKKVLTVLIIAALGLSVFATLSWAQDVYGTVLHDGKPVAHVLIIFRHNHTEEARTITGDDGYYFIKNLPDGNYKVTLAYRDGTKTELVKVAGSHEKLNFDI